MKNAKALKLAKEARKPKVLYECFDYIIEEIPHNYRAIIKCAVNPKEKHRGIDRDYYVHPEEKDRSKEEQIAALTVIVEDVIEKYFLSGVSPEQPIGLKTP